MKNLILLSFLAIILASCGSTSTVHDGVSNDGPFKVRPVSHDFTDGSEKI